MSSMTGNEFKELRTTDTTPAELEQRKKMESLQAAVDAMSTKDFLIGRTKETIQVPIPGLGGTKNIEIRARLSKSEMTQHRDLLDRWKLAQESDIEFIENEEEEAELAAFLEHITIDKQLTSDFWLSGDLDPQTVDVILMEYFVKEPIRRLSEIQKFLGERLRSGL